MLSLQKFDSWSFLKPLSLPCTYVAETVSLPETSVRMVDTFYFRTQWISYFTNGNTTFLCFHDLLPCPYSNECITIYWMYYNAVKFFYFNQSLFLYQHPCITCSMLGCILSIKSFCANKTINFCLLPLLAKTFLMCFSRLICIPVEKDINLVGVDSTLS